MKYRLKDRELQKKLDEISGGDFSVRLNDEGKIDRSIKICFCLMDFDAHFDYEVFPDMVEEVQDYNPKAWNEFPEVEPPEGVWMRVEWRDGAVVRRDVARYVAWGDTNEFVWTNRGVICDVERFRPWLNDDEIEAERNAEYKKDMHPDAIAARRYMGEEDEE